VKDARDGRGAPVLELPGTPSQRIHWQADSLLDYRVWKSPNLTNWNAIDTTEPLDGDIALPSPVGAAGQYYRIEILEPAD
jgi:hypothetical protein